MNYTYLIGFCPSRLVTMSFSFPTSRGTLLKMGRKKLWKLCDVKVRKRQSIAGHVEEKLDTRTITRSLQRIYTCTYAAQCVQVQCTTAARNNDASAQKRIRAIRATICQLQITRVIHHVIDAVQVVFVYSLCVVTQVMNSVYVD